MNKESLDLETNCNIENFDFIKFLETNFKYSEIELNGQLIKYLEPNFIDKEFIKSLIKDLFKKKMYEIEVNPKYFKNKLQFEGNPSSGRPDSDTLVMTKDISYRITLELDTNSIDSKYIYLSIKYKHSLEVEIYLNYKLYIESYNKYPIKEDNFELVFYNVKEKSDKESNDIYKTIYLKMGFVHEIFGLNEPKIIKIYPHIKIEHLYMTNYPINFK